MLDSMIRLLLPLLMLAAAFSTVIAQNEEEAKRQLRVKNRIREGLTYTITIEDEEETGDSVLTAHKFYDSTGREIKKTSDTTIHYFGDTRERWVVVHRDSLLLRQAAYDDDDRLLDYMEKHYDNRGNPIINLQIKPSGDTVTFQRRYYNEKNQDTALYNRQSNGQFVLSMRFYYNESGKSSRTEWYALTEKLRFATVYEYDSNGNLQQTFEESRGNRRVTAYHRYDENHQLIELIVPGQKTGISEYGSVFDDVESVYRYRYDEKGNLIEESTWEDGDLVTRSRHYYLSSQQ